jgi:hypothetical protein
LVKARKVDGQGRQAGRQAGHGSQGKAGWERQAVKVGRQASKQAVKQGKECCQAGWARQGRQTDKARRQGMAIKARQAGKGRQCKIWHGRQGGR